MLEIFAHTHLAHESVLVSIHTRQLSYVGESILKTICQLKRVDIAQTILDVRVNHEFG